MIEEIYIQDLGIIAESRLKFGSGLTVLTGETGAGKTMVLTALGLLLGGRSDSSAVRSGQTQAYVEGRWWLKNPDPVNKRLDEAGIGATDGELILNRVVSVEGRTRASASAKSVPVSLLSELSEQLVVVHGQSDQIRLKSTAAQREALDQFAGRDLLELLGTFQATHSRWLALKATISELSHSADKREVRFQELQTAVVELDQLNAQPREDELISERIQILENLEALRNAAAKAHDCISSDDFDSHDALSLVGLARKTLEQVSNLDAELSRLASEMHQVSSALADVSTDLSRYLSNLESDAESNLEHAQARKASLNSALRKFGPTLDELFAFHEAAKAELLTFEDFDGNLAELEAELGRESQQLMDLGTRLSEARRIAALELEQLVSAELSSLAMPGASLKVNIETMENPGSHGFDSVQFLLSAYPGAEPRALNRGASGGELSRIMLALEVVLARNEQAPTFIFDEVDAGVGGAAAIEIGRRLARLARHAQVIVVTHLAQVAAFADHHLRVAKSSEGGFTNSSVSNLTEFDRVSELARMLSGLDESESAKQHATELLALARAEFT
ncbi:MAG: hypothetical protein RL174_39 [Actinomycetota bacterium]